MKKLQEGLTFYMFRGMAYLGFLQCVGPYGEKKIFLSEIDAEALNIYELVKNLEFKVLGDFGKKKELVKIGEFYQLANKKVT